MAKLSEIQETWNFRYFWLVGRDPIIYIGDTLYPNGVGNIFFQEKHCQLGLRVQKEQKTLGGFHKTSHSTTIYQANNTTLLPTLGCCHEKGKKVLEVETKTQSSEPGKQVIHRSWIQWIDKIQ